MSLPRSDRSGSPYDEQDKPYSQTNISEETHLNIWVISGQRGMVGHGTEEQFVKVLEMLGGKFQYDNMELPKMDPVPLYISTRMLSRTYKRFNTIKDGIVEL